MPGRRRKFRRRDEERRAAFLATKCFICLDEQEAYPSSPLPCCGRRLHEGCLQTWFVKGSGRGHSCPLCKRLLIPVNSGDTTPHIPDGSYLFTFLYIRYEGQHGRYADFDPDDTWDLWLNPSPIPPPPSGWHEARMRDISNNSRDSQ